MSEWKAKRFWKEASVVGDDAGFAVALDGRLVKTPAKRTLAVPTHGLATEIAREWDAQEDKINPAVMPFTRMANAAIDKVSVQHAEVAQMLAAYGDSDLLCYRAQTPAELVSRQSDIWDPVLEWATETLGTKLDARIGVIHIRQRPEVLEELSGLVHNLSAFELAAFHDLVSLTGSLILGLASTHNAKTAAEIWEISRLDEIWQSEQWGKDDEAEAMAEIKKQAFLHAKCFFDLCKG